MDSFLDQISKFSDAGVVIQEGNMLACLALSFVLSMIVAKVYQYSYRGASFSPAFMHTLVICAMAIGAVMLIIGSNIARAFSLVGALSIIRFRNAVKDPRDVAFIFLTMAIGMACGTGFYLIAVTLTLVSCFCIVLMSRFGFGEHGSVEKVLKIQSPPVKDFETLFDPILKEHTSRFNLLSIESSRMGTELELTFGILVKRTFSAEKLLKALSGVNQNLRVQILGSNFTLDL